MALTMYMKVTGKNQGEIKGSCDQGGDKKDKILVYAMDHKVEIPRDIHTGLPTGQRIHHPLTVTKAKDVASPKLFAACCKGEQVDVEIDFLPGPTLTVILSTPTTGKHRKDPVYTRKKAAPAGSLMTGWGFDFLYLCRILELS